MKRSKKEIAGILRENIKLTKQIADKKLQGYAKGLRDGYQFALKLLEDKI